MSPQDGPVRFGDYYLMDKIAVGGMAEIWRGKAVGLEGFERTVALKLILPSYTQNAEFNSMFVEEARIASSLNHSNIVRITNFGVSDGRYYHEEEFIDGRSVRQILQKCRDNEKLLPIDSACYIISEVCKGLHYAHTKHDPVTNEALNVIHRDMSPQNVMVSFEGEVKIVDWGIAKAKGKMEETRAGVLKGKFGYMSPEQAEGEELDSRTDIFSLGIVFYEAVTGERLFVADNEINTLKKIKEGNVPSPSKVNPVIDKELESIVLKMLARPRIERYQSCYDVHEDILKYLHKKFPAYNSLKLSKFIKELFSTEILADRKRMSEREQSMPSYSPLSYGSRSSEDKTRVSASDEGSASYDKYPTANDRDKTLLADHGTANKKVQPEVDPTMETRADVPGNNNSYVPRPRKNIADDISSIKKKHRPSRPVGSKKLRTRIALFLVLGVLLYLAYSVPQKEQKVSSLVTSVKDKINELQVPAKSKPAEPEAVEQKEDAAEPEQAKQEPVKHEPAKQEPAKQEHKVVQQEPAEQEAPPAPEPVKHKPNKQAKEPEKTKDAATPQPKTAAQKEAIETTIEEPVVKKEDYSGKTGSLSLSSEPVSADVVIDGEPKGRTPITVKGIALGKKHELSLKAMGFETLNKKFMLRRESNNLVLTLSPNRNSGRTYISIDLQPPAQVFIDDQLVSSFKSVYMYQVEPGLHNLRFVNKKLDIDYSTTVRVERGEHLQKNITLR